MEEKLLDGDATDNLESLHNVRLTALLHDLMNEGKMGAAQLLGVNHKTLTAARDSGVLTPRLSDALEKVLLSRELESLEKVKELVEEMGGRLEAVEKQAQGIPGEIEDAVRGEVERRMVEWTEAGTDGSADSQGEDTPDAEDDGGSRPRKLFRTVSPSVITMDPQPGDEDVFGEAWTLVEEWRRLREKHPAQGKGLAWLVDEERLRELEIALIGEHELTVPPDTDPWDSLGRRTQVRWRIQTLRRVRRERALARIRRWIRRKLTFGLWGK